MQGLGHKLRTERAAVPVIHRQKCAGLLLCTANKPSVTTLPQPRQLCNMQRDSGSTHDCMSAPTCSLLPGPGGQLASSAPWQLSSGPGSSRADLPAAAAFPAESDSRRLLTNGLRGGKWQACMKVDSASTFANLGGRAWLARNASIMARKTSNLICYPLAYLPGSGRPWKTGPGWHLCELARANRRWATKGLEMRRCCHAARKTARSSFLDAGTPSLSWPCRPKKC